MDDMEAREEKRARLWREGQATVFFVFLCMLAFAAIFFATGGGAYLKALLRVVPTPVEQQQPEQ